MISATIAETTVAVFALLDPTVALTVFCTLVFVASVAQSLFVISTLPLCPATTKVTTDSSPVSLLVLRSFPPTTLSFLAA